MPFDPYYKWLGIPPAEQPPNHYRLLGITLFEGNADAIESAADQRMVHLRTFQTGQHARESQKLLNAVSAAKLVLLQPPKKAQYDAQLRAKLNQTAVATQNGAQAEILPQATALAQQAPAADDDMAAESGGGADWQADSIDYSTPGVRRRTSGVRKKSGVPTGLVGGGVAVAVVALAAIGYAISRSNDAAPADAPSDPAVSQPIAVAPLHPHDDKRPAQPASAGPAKSGEVRVASLPQKPPAINGGGSPSKTGNPSPTAPVGGANGGSPDEMPADGEIGSADLARRRGLQIPPDDRGSKPLLGPNDPSLSSGKPDKSGKPTDAPADGSAATKIAGDTESRVTPPDDVAQQKALQQLKDVLKDDFAGAKSPEAQLALAQKLQKLATDTKNDPAGRYVMFSQALELATKCADVGLTTAILDSLSNSFDFDIWDLRQKTFTQLARGAKTPDDRAAIAKAALELAEQALPDGHAEIAVALTTTALNLAAAAKDVALHDQAKDLNERAKRMQKEQIAYDEALKRLKTAPDDAAANLLVGRIKCFVLEDWANGPAYLVKGADEALKAVAKQEAANPTDAEQQAKLADGWWDQADSLAKKAERKDDPVLKSIHNRAMYWYRLAAPNLTGLIAAKVQKKIDAEEAAKPEGPITETAYLDDMAEQNPSLANASLGKHGETGYERRGGYGGFGGGAKRGGGRFGGIPAPDVPGQVVVNGQAAKHALSLQPQANGSATVAYQLDGKYRAFEGVVAVMDGATQPCAVQFRVFADKSNKPLWVSRVLSRPGEFQSFALRIAKVQTLQLEIRCQGSNAGALTAWINPAVGK